MKLVGVRVEMPSNTPIVLLQETSDDTRMLPIFIGQAEATAIALALEDVDTPRPMTHDLVRDLLVVMGATLEITTGHRVKQATCGFAEKVHYRFS